MLFSSSGDGDNVAGADGGCCYYFAGDDLEGDDLEGGDLAEGDDAD